MVERPPRDQDQRRRAAELGALADQLSQRALEVTTPVYRTSANGKPEAEGTAVLMVLGDFRFLLSAGHVLERLDEEFLSADAGGVIVPIQGERTYVYAAKDDPTYGDTIDIRIVRLLGTDWERVPPSAFVHWNELDHQLTLPERHSFGLVGYPYTKQRNSVKGTTVEARAYRVTGKECAVSVYRDLEIDPEISLLIGFDKRKTWGPEGMVTAPDLYGASGCGLWRFGRNLRTTATPARLSGIGVIWQHKGPVKYVRATRIVPILAAISSRYKDARDVIERYLSAAADGQIR